MEIPEGVRKLTGRGRVMAMATVTREGTPNVVPMLQYWWHGEELVVGDLFMKATRENVKDNGRVCLSVWDEEIGEAYKLVGTARYETEGDAYDMANAKLRKKKPEKNFKGVVVIKVSEIYDAARGENAGRLIAKG